MSLAILLGVLTGIIGFTPLLVAIFLARRGHQIVRQHAVSLGLVLVLASGIVLVVALFVFWRVRPDAFLVFGASVVGAFLLATFVLAVMELWRSRR